MTCVNNLLTSKLFGKSGFGFMKKYIKKCQLL